MEVGYGDLFAINRDQFSRVDLLKLKKVIKLLSIFFLMKRIEKKKLYYIRISYMLNYFERKIFLFIPIRIIVDF